MKKIVITFCLAFALLLANGYSYAASDRTMQAKINSKRIVAGTRFNLELLNDTNTAKDDAGSSFDAALTDDIKVDDIVMLPIGTVVRGMISNVQPPRRLSRGAVLYIDFDHVVSPEGKQLPISAALADIKNITVDGGVIGGGNYGYAFKQNAKQSGDIIMTCTDWGIDVGKDKLGGYLQYITTPIAFFGGAIGGGAYLIGESFVDLFRKGEDVVLPKGTDFSILLLKDLDVPVIY